MGHCDSIIIGAGIVGLAMALDQARRGRRVVVLEREPRALGASIRNFGMVWPIGQAEGVGLQRAMRSRAIWDELAEECGFWFSRTGSLHLAYRPEEMRVLEEFRDSASDGSRPGSRLLAREEVMAISPGARPNGLLGGLWSATEALVDPREAMAVLPEFLEERYGVEFHFGTAVYHVSKGMAEAPQGTWHADRVYVCSGAEFSLLFPEAFAAKVITRCKLQMMRTGTQPGDWRMGPPLCGGLTLLHYGAFAQCPGTVPLRALFDEMEPRFADWGIHVMVCQNGRGELVIGDSHHYGASHDPFDREDINGLILEYLSTFFRAPELRIAATWNGTYAKMLHGEPALVWEMDEGVWVVNGLGGAGMTLSFGLAEEIGA